MKFYGSDITPHRNWQDETERTEAKANSEIIVRKATPEELAKFEHITKRIKEGTRYVR